MHMIHVENVQSDNFNGAEVVVGGKKKGKLEVYLNTLLYSLLFLFAHFFQVLLNVILYCYVI